MPVTHVELIFLTTHNEILDAIIQERHAQCGYLTRKKFGMRKNKSYIDDILSFFLSETKGQSKFIIQKSDKPVF